MARLGPHARLANPASALGGSEFPGWRNQPNGTIARETDLVLGARQAVAALAAIEAWFEAHRELAPPGGDAAR